MTPMEAKARALAEKVVNAVISQHGADDLFLGVGYAAGDELRQSISHALLEFGQQQRDLVIAGCADYLADRSCACPLILKQLLASKERKTWFAY